jgi:hypothetical protein
MVLLTYMKETGAPVLIGSIGALDHGKRGNGGGIIPLIFNSSLVSL